MRLINTQTTHYSILLICEGTHTEPNFFSAMVDWLKENGKINFEVQILPKPTITLEDNELDLGRGMKERKKRILKNDTNFQRELENTILFPGEQPLNWVKAGLEQLTIFDEVWTIFDKDGHPKTAKAFELSQETEVEGKKLKIAFSSRCFEYYLLLHFELIYKAFEKSECNGKKYVEAKHKSKTISYHCMTSYAVEGKACQGDKCINGYARLKKYWDDSKGAQSTFPIVKDKLWVGIYNAHAVRWKSNILFPDLPFYTHNPYVDVDRLTCRLMGYRTLEHKEANPIKKGNDYCIIKRIDDSIIFSLESNTIVIISSGDVMVYNNLTGESHEAGVRFMLTPEQVVQTLDLQSVITKDEYCIITVLNESYFCTLMPEKDFLNE